MPGTFSQAIANLNQAAQTCAGISGLPPNADPIQAAISATDLSLGTGMSDLQAYLQMEAGAVITNLNEAIQQIDAGGTATEISATLEPTRARAEDMQVTTIGQVHAAQEASTTISTAVSRLTTISSSISVQIASLQGQLASAQSEESSAEKKYYYLLLLGPFGLAGLPAALALYLSWQSDVSNLEDQVSSINQQIAILSAMQTATNQLTVNTQNLVNAVTDLSNACTSLSADVTNIQQDLSDGKPLSTIALFIQTALKEVSTLQIDVS